MKPSTKRAIVWSVVVHVVLLGGLLWWGLTPVPDTDATSQRERVKPDPREVAPPPEPEPKNPVPEGVTEEALAKRLREAIDSAPPADPAELDKKLDYVERHMDEKTVTDIGRFIQKAYGAEKRAYEPVTPQPEGRFDIQSQLLYSVKTETWDDGLTRKVTTFVDKDGRTLRQTRREIVDEHGERKILLGIVEPGKPYDEFIVHGYEKVEQPDSAGMKLIERMSESPILQKLMSQAFSPIANEKLKESKDDARSVPPAPKDDGEASPSANDSTR